MIKTNLKPRDYSIYEVVRIVNPKQYLLYIKNGVYPIDMYTSIDAIQTTLFWQLYFLKKKQQKSIKNGAIMN